VSVFDDFSNGTKFLSTRWDMEHCLETYFAQAVDFYQWQVLCTYTPSFTLFLTFSMFHAYVSYPKFDLKIKIIIIYIKNVSYYYASMEN